MEEDLKCFEEEIRLSGYSDLLEKVRIERARQKEQVKSKKRQEASINGDFDDESEDETTEISKETKETRDSSSEKEQQQQQRKRKPANRNASNPKKPRASAIEATKKTTKQETSVESDEEPQTMKISRAERLLRRNKPNYVGKESTNENNKSDEEKEDDNQGDDEAESEEDENDQVNESDKSDIEDDEEEVKTEVKEDPQETFEVTTPTASVTEPSLQSARSTRRQSKPSSSTEQVYCTCNRVSFGEMIGCDAKDCPVEWFHYECVGLKSPPKGKWYCRGCQEAMDAKTAAQLAVGISTRSTRRSG